MNWQTALEIMLARTDHQRYRWYCSAACPEHMIWRKRLIELAEGPPVVSIPIVPGPPVKVDYGSVIPIRSCCGG